MIAIFALLTISCSSGGEDNPVAPSPGADAQLEQRAVERLVDLYRAAVEQEDIDRLAELLEPARPMTPFQTRGRVLDASRVFRDAMSERFRRLTINGLDIPPDRLEIAPDQSQVAFLEIESSVDHARLEFQTFVFRTTLALQRDVMDGVVVFRIVAAERDGPVLRVATRQQMIAGAPVRLEVTAPDDTFDIAGVTTDLSGSADVHFRRLGTGWQGIVTLPGQDSQPIPLLIRDQGGEIWQVPYRFRLRRSDQRAVQRLDGTGITRLLALAIDDNGRVWAGGDQGGQLYVADSATSTATFVGNLLGSADGRIEGLTFDTPADRPPRLHAAVISVDASTSGVIVVDTASNPLGVCQTVNIFDADGELDANYPFFVEDLETGTPTPSSSTRVIAARAGGIWLYGSDGGVARATSDLAADLGDCTPSVRYQGLLQRQNSNLLSNTVPGLLETSDGALWLGTTLGLVRRAAGQSQLTPLRFDPGLALPENIDTLEALFGALAEAIFDSRPLTTTGIGDVVFDQVIVKTDLITSLAEDDQGRVWAGSLGGGLRRIDFHNGQLQETLHLTRQGVARIDPRTQDRDTVPGAGLISNIVLALAIGPDQTVWAATNEGLSRIRETEVGLEVVNISALDGLGAPIRDVEVSADGTVWLATDQGLFRLQQDGNRLEGVVRTPDGQPVAGVEVRLLGTPFRASTNADGRYVLVGLPPGEYQLLFDGSLASDGWFSNTLQVVSVGNEPTADAMLDPILTDVQLIPISGDTQSVVGDLITLEVAAVDREGNFRAGVPVTFSFKPGQGRGSVAQSSPLTASSGRARADVIVISAGLNVVRVRRTDDPAAPGVEFALVAQANRAQVRIIKVSGNNQSGRAGQVTKPLVVRLEDQFGNPIAGEVVTGDILQGAAVFTASNDKTARVSSDGKGEASFVVRVGSDEQDNDLLIRVSALSQTAQFLTTVGTVDTAFRPEDMVIRNDVAYVADATALQVIDMSDPTTTRVAGAVRLFGRETRLALDDSRLYVMTRSPVRLYITDLTDPLMPAELGCVSFSTDGFMAGGAVWDGFAYVATFPNKIMPEGNIFVVDVRDPAALECSGDNEVSPAVVDVISLNSRPVDLAIQNGKAYVTTVDDGFLLYDLSDPSRPTFISRVDGRFDSRIALGQGTAHVIEQRESNNVFTVLDLNNSAEPVRVGGVKTRLISGPRNDFSIDSDGNFAYVVESAAGVHVIDVRSPQTPRIVTLLETPSEATNVVAAERFIYVTDLVFGLQIFPAPGPNPIDTDGDGVIDFFDLFALDPSEARDTDRDGIGDNADDDADNDFFLNDEDTDPLDPSTYPVLPPPPGASTVIVDANVPNTNASVRLRNGTPEQPYRSITEALRALRASPEQTIETLILQPGVYSRRNTNEVFPIDFRELEGLTIRSAEPENKEIRDETIINSGFKSTGLFLKSDMTVAGLTVWQNTTGIFAQSEQNALLNNLTIRHSRIQEHIFAGIQILDPLGENLVADNEVVRNGRDGITIDSRNIDEGFVRVTGNTIRESGDEGVELLRTTGELTGNTITESRVDGVVISVGSTINDFSGNTIANNTQDGVRIDNGSQVTLRDNDLKENDGLGLLIINPETVVTAENNRINLNGEAGIRVDRSARGTLVGNQIEANEEDAGIRVTRGAKAELQRNTILDNVNGIIIAQTSTEATVTENVIMSNQGEGVRVDRTRKGTLIGNQITASAKQGVRIRRGAIATLTGNTITASEGVGIEVEDEKSDATLMDNRVTEGMQDGIVVHNGAMAAIAGGEVSQNALNGIVLDEVASAGIALTGNPLTIAGNDKAGIVVTGDGVAVTIDEPRITFRDNAEGPIIGPFMAP